MESSPLVQLFALYAQASAVFTFSFKTVVSSVCHWLEICDTVHMLTLLSLPPIYADLAM